MGKRVLKSGLIGLLLLLLSVYVLKETWLIGDGGEYLLMTHALFRHASVVIHPGDIEEFRRLPMAELIRMNFQLGSYTRMQQLFHSAHPLPWGGFASIAPDRYYSIHFWLYSLLAVPFYGLLHLLGLNPVWALAMVNLGFAGATLLYLRRALPDHAMSAALLFLAMGTTFYLGWTGPEVMTASCALMACIAALRGEVGFAALLCGLGASQNPSLIFMLPFIFGFRALLFRWPQLAWPGSSIPAMKKRDLALALLGIVLALLPYVFFQWIFGIPSLAGKYFTSPDLISWNRFVSLFVDLDQGMLIGLPGLFAALIAATWLCSAPQRARWIGVSLMVIAVVLVMAMPALGAINWNSGCVVVMRYAYWLAMPLLALVLLALHCMPKKAGIWLAALALGLQAGVFVEDGMLGEKSSPVGHTPQARWMFRHFPAYYNPDAEIFYERSVGNEDPMPRNLTYLYQLDGRPLKLLRHQMNFEASPEFCAAGQRLQGVDVRTVDSGWQYEHPPFHCQTLPHLEQIGMWYFDAAHADSQALLTNGWSKPETAGVWSDAQASTLSLPIDGGGRALRLRVRGSYYGRQRDSAVSINGGKLGDIDLSNAVINLPADPRRGNTLTIVLGHVYASSPKSHGDSADARLLGFYLRTVSVEALSE